MANTNKDKQGVQTSKTPVYGNNSEADNKGNGNTENGQMPEDVIERKMFDFDAVRKETEGGTNDSFDSSDEVEVKSKESEPDDKATQNSNLNTLDRRSNIQTQQSTDSACVETRKKDKQDNKDAREEKKKEK